MMMRSLLLVVLAIAASAASLQNQRAVFAQDLGAVPQVRPVIAWLSAVKSGDQDQLKLAFSADMQRQFEKDGWSKVLDIYRQSFQRAFGDYALSDFSFEFIGGEDSGHVNVAHNGNQWPAVRVIRENTGWKVNER